MDKNSIKKFAVWARIELIKRVSLRAQKYGVTQEKIEDANADSINGYLLSADEKKERQALIKEVNEKGYEEVMEEVAYTWFNRFIALRFMEVNEFLPVRVRVFTDENNEFKPQIIDEAIHLEFDGLNREKVLSLKSSDSTDELYKYLLTALCNNLNAYLPQMFQKIADYTELLFPDNLLRQESVIAQMINDIDEADWKDEVQIIGWLYQYYNAEKKDNVFALLKKNVKITKENIPAATQLFTPDWIVRYMVENSLGRLWVEGHPNEELKSNWRYYLEEAEQEKEVEEKLELIRQEHAKLEPRDIKVIDPCCGSGHILVYMFDVLMQIYLSYGYTSREAVESIIENNIYGLDIDERASQLAYFAVMMRGCKYDRRFFKRKDDMGRPVVPQPNVYAINESNFINTNTVAYFANGNSKLKLAIDTIVRELYDAKEYGSIINVTEQDWDALYNRFDEIYDDISLVREDTLKYLLPLVKIAQAMAQKYDVVVTNPPYMGANGMTATLSNFVKKQYPDSKADLFAVFIEKCSAMLKKNAYQAMITMHSWMFLTSFEKLRGKILNRDIVNMVHLGARAFEEIGGEVVQTTSFVLQNCHDDNRKATYCRLVEPTNQKGKEDMFLEEKNRYITEQSNFYKIPGSPVAYWASESLLNCFCEGKGLGDMLPVKKGADTGDNNKFLRLWFEINNMNFSCFINTDRWVPYAKGGDFRKWIGNNNYVINWFDNGCELKKSKANLRSPQLYFKKSITWSAVSTARPNFRFNDKLGLFDSSGSSLFPNEENINYILGLLNTEVINEILNFINPTINYGAGSIANIPVIMDDSKKDYVEILVKNNINLSKSDWDSFETSWDFERNPLVKKQFDIKNTALNSDGSSRIKGSPMEVYYMLYKFECEQRFKKLKENEEELNRIFIDIYGLQDELTPEVEDKDITVYRIFDDKKDIPESMQKSKYALTKQDVVKDFISYAVGCMFGRYSLNVSGLAYAGGEWDEEKYETFPADKDNIIPIFEEDYTDDDIVGKFVKFVGVVFGEEFVDDNLKFIADALGGSGSPRDVIRKYFLNDFYKDHCKKYQKRPIYWLFDSGKKNGFKALIYMHRYESDTIARIRTDYVHDQQGRIRAKIEQRENDLNNATASGRVKINKEIANLKEQDAEVRIFEEKIHHLADQMIEIDLDDGVKNNYEIFKDVLSKIK